MSETHAQTHTYTHAHANAELSQKHTHIQRVYERDLGPGNVIMKYFDDVDDSEVEDEVRFR